MKISLCGKWRFKHTGGEWSDGTVPGCNYTDLINIGAIADPFIGMNERKAEWVERTDCTYEKTFDLTREDTDCLRVELVMDMLDTVAEVLVNGKSVLSACNTHIGYRIDVKNCVKTGENVVTVMFRSPVNYTNAKQNVDPMPRNNMGLSGIPHIRKAQCHYGWDWGPILPLSGITRDIYVDCYDKKIKGVECTQTHRENAVELNVKCETYGDISGLTFCLYYRSEVIMRCAAENNSATFTIDNPHLWWSNGMGKETGALYEVRAYAEGAETIGTFVGLRTISLNREKDRYGTNFQFIVNGVPVFAKGANWIPADSFPARTGSAKLEFLIKSMADAHMNMVRVWGGGYYESDEFYALCDKYGILVWQDFCFACAPYPFYNEKFLASVKKEVAYNVNRLKGHASLALFCGNNEIECMTVGWRAKRKLVQWTKKFFWEILPDYLAQFNSCVPYIPTSPVGDKFLKRFGNPDIGDTHLWAVWHGLQPLTHYRKRKNRFCSEFGLESLPDIETIEGFSEGKNLDLFSPVFAAHQKCTSGNQKMLFYTSTRFRIPADFNSLVLLTQIAQAECVRDATEHWRRYRGRCNGSLYWQYNDCWPVCSWSGIDYAGKFKALQYAAKKFNAPVMLSIENEKAHVSLFAVNDTVQDLKASVELRLEDFYGNVLDKERLECTFRKTAGNKILDKDYTKLLKRVGKNAVAVAELIIGGRMVSRKTCLFDAEKNLKLPKTDIALSAEIKGDTAYITLCAHTFSRYVKVSLKGAGNISDNFFDMTAGERVTLQAHAGGRSADELLSEIKIFSAADITPKQSRFKDAVFRLKTRLKPINLANIFFYKFLQ